MQVRLLQNAGGEEMFYIKGQEVNSLGDLPEENHE
nr:MAG TPA: hypothetical protein [Bacteriophage sp.]